MEAVKEIEQMISCSSIYTGEDQFDHQNHNFPRPIFDAIEKEVLNWKKEKLISPYNN